MPPLTQTFGAARMAVGALSWLAPAMSARVFGLKFDSDPVFTQLFGARDFALGALTALSTETDLTRVLALGLAIDTADAIGCARQHQSLSVHAKILTAGGAVLFAAIGAAALLTPSAAADVVPA